MTTPTWTNPVAGLLAADHYTWASDLFDYLTVQAPNDDYLPDMNPDRYDYATGAPPSAASPYGYTPNPVPQYTPNSPAVTIATANRGNEDLAPVEGLININTAPWRVLAALPMVTDPATGAVLPDENAQVAQSIVDYRDGRLDDPATYPAHGPFKSIYDLNKVPGFATAGDAARPPTNKRGMIAASHAALATLDPGPMLGDIAPRTPPTGSTLTTDGAVGDFEARYLVLNRISNMITTRSDSYTVYVLVQGWRGVGSANPELVVQRRRAFMADRTGVTPTSRDVTTQNFYNE
jgi:hypothetical protein